MDEHGAWVLKLEREDLQPSVSAGMVDGFCRIVPVSRSPQHTTLTWTPCKEIAHGVVRRTPCLERGAHAGARNGAARREVYQIEADQKGSEQF